jgi:hypothetical protein
MAEKMASGDWMQYLTKLEETLNEYFGKKAPALPENWKKFLAKVAPYLIIISAVLSIPAIMAIFGTAKLLGSAVPGAMMYFNTWEYKMSWAFMVVALALEIMAVPSLFKLEKKGWNLMFYASLLGVIQNAVLFNFFGLIIGALISFYVLFQIRSQYK